MTNNVDYAKFATLTMGLKHDDDYYANEVTSLC